MYEVLTAYIPAFETGGFGEWTEQTGDGSPEHPLEYCHIEYDESTKRFIEDIWDFGKKHE